MNKTAHTLTFHFKQTKFHFTLWHDSKTTQNFTLLCGVTQKQSEFLLLILLTP